MYAVYKSIFSTSAAMIPRIKKNATVTNVLLPSEIHAALFGLQVPHKLPQSSHCRQTSTDAAVRYSKYPTVTKVPLPFEINVTLWASGNAQNCSKDGAGETGIFVCSNTTYAYSECFLLKKDWQ